MHMCVCLIIEWLEIVSDSNRDLEHWFSTFLKLPPLIQTLLFCWPPIKLWSLLLHNCFFTAAINPKANIFFPMFLWDYCERVHWLPKGIPTHKLTSTILEVSEVGQQKVNLVHIDNTRSSHQLLEISKFIHVIVSDRYESGNVKFRLAEEANWQDWVQTTGQ